jgi:hypothetical protein
MTHEQQRIGIAPRKARLHRGTSRDRAGNGLREFEDWVPRPVTHSGISTLHTT